MTDPKDPGWVEQHVIAFALGALGESKEQQFRQMIANDSEFADLLTPEDIESIGHVPAALIARWDAVGRVLDETERELVVEHARECPSCREELELLGFPLPEATDPQTHAGSASWRGWLGGIVLGAAAMLAFVMFASPPLPGRHPSTPSTSGPTTSHLQGRVIEVVTPLSNRGAESEVVSLPTDASAFLLAVNLPIDVPSGAAATVVLVGPSGKVLTRSVLDPAPWSPPSTQILVLGDPHFRAGEYQVELDVEGETAARGLGRFTIELKR